MAGGIWRGQVRLERRVPGGQGAAAASAACPGDRAVGPGGEGRPTPRYSPRRHIDDI